MINKGDLLQSLGWATPSMLVEVLRTYNKRDVDPECLESVAIIGMVEIIVLSGMELGRVKRYNRFEFDSLFKRIEEA
jgi:hypothetical protein